MYASLDRLKSKNITASNLKKAETRLEEGDSKLLPEQNQILFAPSNGK